jgi:hypothetical protein
LNGMLVGLGFVCVALFAGDGFCRVLALLCSMLALLCSALKLCAGFVMFYAGFVVFCFETLFGPRAFVDCIIMSCVQPNNWFTLLPVCCFYSPRCVLFLSNYRWAYLVCSNESFSCGMLQLFARGFLVVCSLQEVVESCI